MNEQLRELHVLLDKTVQGLFLLLVDKACNAK